MSAVANQALVDQFIDALWLEDGLARNTLDAYRRDLQLFCHWLQARELAAVVEADLHAYFAHRHAATTNSTRYTIFSRCLRIFFL